VRARAIYCCLFFGLLPWWAYERHRHYDCSWWYHLRINACLAWRWLSFQEDDEDRAFETKFNPTYPHFLFMADTPKINPAVDTFSAPQPKGDKFEVVVTNPNGQEVTRKEFGSAQDGRQWSKELTSAAAAKTAGTTLANDQTGGIRNDAPAKAQGKDKRNSTLSL
jgi:hypothetical protein